MIYCIHCWIIEFLKMFDEIASLVAEMDPVCARPVSLKTKPKAREVSSP